MIKDVQGIEAKVGDKVAFAGGGRGASEFYVGFIHKINNATVTIVYEKLQYVYDTNKREYVASGLTGEFINRKEFMFAILGEQ